MHRKPDLAGMAFEATSESVSVVKPHAQISCRVFSHPLIAWKALRRSRSHNLAKQAQQMHRQMQRQNKAQEWLLPQVKLGIQCIDTNGYTSYRKALAPDMPVTLQSLENASDGTSHAESMQCSNLDVCVHACNVATTASSSHSLLGKLVFSLFPARSLAHRHTVWVWGGCRIQHGPHAALFCHVAYLVEVPASKELKRLSPVAQAGQWTSHFEG